MIQINDYFEKCITSTNFKFFNNKSPLYMNVFVQAVHANTNTRISFPKLCQPLRKTNQRQKKLSHVATNIWNSLPDSLKSTKGLNTYKHRLKKHFLVEATSDWFYLFFNYYLLFLSLLLFYHVIIIIIIIIITISTNIVITNIANITHIVITKINITTITVIITLTNYYNYYHYFHYLCYYYQCFHIIIIIMSTLNVFSESAFFKKLENVVIFFKGTTMDIKPHSFLMLSLPSHLMILFIKSFSSCFFHIPESIYCIYIFVDQ